MLSDYPVTTDETSSLMKTHYEHQPRYSENPPELTPRRIMWLTPESIQEHKLLEDIANELRDSKTIQAGFTGIDKECLIIYKYDS